MKIQKYIQEAQHAINALANDKKATIASVRAYWVSYVSSEEPCLAIPKSARTKAQIIRELEDIREWLNRFGRVDKHATPETATFAHEAALAEDFARLIEAQRAAGLPVDEEGNDLREWCGNDIEAAHTEALAMNEQPQQTKQTGAKMKNYHAVAIAAIALAIAGIASTSAHAAGMYATKFQCGPHAVTFDVNKRDRLEIIVDGDRAENKHTNTSESRGMVSAFGEGDNRVLWQYINTDGEDRFNIVVGKDIDKNGDVQAYRCKPTEWVDAQ